MEKFFSNHSSTAFRTPKIGAFYTSLMRSPVAAACTNTVTASPKTTTIIPSTTRTTTQTFALGHIALLWLHISQGQVHDLPLPLFVFLHIRKPTLKGFKLVF
jgi:hypothetical protein